MWNTKDLKLGGLISIDVNMPKGFCMSSTHVAGQFLVVLHHLLVLLVDGQHFANTICSCLSLSGDRVMSGAHGERMKHCHRVRSLCPKLSGSFHCS